MTCAQTNRDGFMEYELRLLAYCETKERSSEGEAFTTPIVATQI